MKDNFKVTCELVQKPGSLQSNCGTIQFLNDSLPGVVVYIDSLPLNQGESWEDTAQAGELNVTRYNVTASAPGFRLVVRRKMFSSTN